MHQIYPYPQVKMPLMGGLSGIFGTTPLTTKEKVVLGAVVLGLGYMAFELLHYMVKGHSYIGGASRTPAAWEVFG